MQNFRELNDEELATVAGGSHHSAHSSHTAAGITVHASADGGYLHIDKVITKTKSISITTADGESVSTVVGFGIAIAI